MQIKNIIIHSLESNFGMTSHFFLLLTLFAMFSYVEATKGNTEFIGGLAFINKLRDCSLICKHCGIKLPELTLYKPTSNSVVNMKMEEEYIKFWQELRQQGYDQYVKQLVDHSRGAAFAVFVTPLDGSDVVTMNGSIVAKHLRPLFRRPSRTAFSKALKEEFVLDALERLAEKSYQNNRIEREMVLSAIKLMNIAAQIASCSWNWINVLEFEELRSDDRALTCISSDWDRNASIPKILYLTYFLNARKLISHLSNNTEESKVVTLMQMELERIIKAEFPFKMTKELSRIKVIDGALNYDKDGHKCRRVFDEVRLLSVKKPRSMIIFLISVFLDDRMLYILIQEPYFEKYSSNWDGLLIKILNDIIKDSFVMSENPMGMKCDRKR